MSSENYTRQVFTIRIWWTSVCSEAVSEEGLDEAADEGGSQIDAALFLRFGHYGIDS